MSEFNMEKAIQFAIKAAQDYAKGSESDALLIAIGRVIKAHNLGYGLEEDQANGICEAIKTELMEGTVYPIPGSKIHQLRINEL